MFKYLAVESRLQVRKFFSKYCNAKMMIVLDLVIALMKNDVIKLLSVNLEKKLLFR